MKTSLVLFAIITLLGLTVYPQEIRVIETGTFHGGEIEAKDGDIWLGLYKQGDSNMLLPSVLSVVSVYDAIVDAEGESSGKRITVPGMAEPLFIIKGEGFVQARPVFTFEEFSGEIDPGAGISFRMEHTEYTLQIESEKKGEGGFVQDGSSLILSNGKIQQTIYRVKECSFCRWRIDWIGDLDSDGKPDLYLYLTHHYNIANQKLFLSSKAGSGKLVKEVAEFTTTGC